jgi:5-methylcytosine-specific restriction endonuclease McrA
VAGANNMSRATERRAKLLKAGKCYSHSDRDVVPGFRSCQECLDYAKQRNKKLLKADKCPSHPARDVVPGFRSCQECLDGHKQRFKRRRKRCLKADKCAIHPARNVVPGFKSCQACLDGFKQRRKELLKADRCPNHSDRDVVPGLTMCRECLDYQKEYSKQHRKQCLKVDRCPSHPDRDVVPGLKMCQVCSKNRAIHNNIRRAKKNFVPNEQVDRLVVFERDDWKCQHCGMTVNEHNGEADHIVPISIGGPHCYWNHQTLCKPCNDEKKHYIRKEPRLAHLVHLPIKKLIEAFAKEQGATLPRGWWEQREEMLRKRGSRPPHQTAGVERTMTMKAIVPKVEQAVFRPPVRPAPRVEQAILRPARLEVR